MNGMNKLPKKVITGTIYKSYLYSLIDFKSLLLFGICTGTFGEYVVFGSMGFLEGGF